MVLQEGKKQSGAAKRGEEDATDEFERKVKSAFSGFHGGPKSKGDVKGEGSLKRRRLIDGESEGEDGDGWTEGERRDAGPSPRVDRDEKQVPLSKRAKMVGSEEKSWEGKQKQGSLGRGGREGGNAERDSPREGKSRERGTSLPPKADKDRMRKAALDGEAALPPSKRRNRAFAAMSACEAEAATASAAECREQAGDGASGREAGSNDGARNEGAEGGGSGSPLKAATVTPDISESGDGGQKAAKAESGHGNGGGQERIEGKRHVALRDSHATESPGKGSGSEEASRVVAMKVEGRVKSLKSKSAVASHNPGGHGSPGATKASLEGATEKRKGQLTGSESGKLSTSTSGGAEAFASHAKASFDDSIIKNA